MSVEGDHGLPGPALRPSLDAELSAARVITRGQAVVLFAALAVGASLLAVFPSLTVSLLVLAIGASSVLFATYALITSAIGARAGSGAPAPPRLDEGRLPRYTILVPLYRETAIIGGLIGALRRLDYPSHLLDVKLLVEVDDLDTVAALRAARLPAYFELLAVPADGPRTKPKACNFGLEHARGELVTIYDAEDEPEPDQLRKAAAALLAAAPDVACVQAALAFRNSATNLLTRFSAADFRVVFALIRPGLERLRAPMPLGGTSNHFRARLLAEMGGWDEFNVAEDADLGIRLARAGFCVRMLDSTTSEEASPRLGNWIRQRSRWIKGYMQTWLVHNRHPVRLVRQLGPRAALHFNLTMLAPIVPALVRPLLSALALLWLLASLGVAAALLPYWVLAVSAGSFAFVTAAESWMYTAALRHAGRRDSVRDGVLFSACRHLLTVAAVKALFQLVTRPSYWEKTVHGFDQVESLQPSFESPRSASAANRA